MKSLRKVILTLLGLCAIVAAQPRTFYPAVEIDRFVAERGIQFPPDYQITLIESMIRQSKRKFKTTEIIREGETIPEGKRVLRIAGTIIEFKPGSRKKRYFVGLGLGRTVVRANVKLTDVASGELLVEFNASGILVAGFAGGNSEDAGDHLAEKIMKIAKTEHVLEVKKK